MRVKKIQCTFIFTVFTVFSSSFASEILNCSISNLPINFGDGIKVNVKKPIIYFKYNRDSVEVYQYPGTPSVNAFINETGIAFKGEYDSVNAATNRTIERFFMSEILGIANIVNASDRSKGLKDCEFFVADKRTGSFYNELPSSLDATIFQVIEACTSARLCKALGAVNDADFARARVDPRDFGPMSIWSRNLQTAFPKMISPKLAENNLPKKRANLIEAADSIIRNVAEKFHHDSNGTIGIPDIQRRVFTAAKGCFQGLNNLQRDESVQIRASPPSEIVQFSFTFGIPEGHVTYVDYKAFRLLPFVGSLCADIQDILFTAVIQMDFSQEYCRPSLKDFITASNGTAKSYTCGRLSMFTNPIMQWFVDAWDNSIIDAVESQVEWAMAAYIYDKFDCENFRQNKNHTT